MEEKILLDRYGNDYKVSRIDDFMEWIKNTIKDIDYDDVEEALRVICTNSITRYFNKMNDDEWDFK